jgi:hypothetical protein
MHQKSRDFLKIERCGYLHSFRRFSRPERSGAFEQLAVFEWGQFEACLHPSYDRNQL